MKKLMIYFLILFCTVLGSCKKFLTEYSQDEMRPSTTNDLAALMYSDAYPYSIRLDNLDLLTDDVQSNGLATTNGTPVANYVTPFNNGIAMFTFSSSMFDAGSIIPAGANLYENCYSKIKGCNVVLDQLANVSGTEQAKNLIKGQCLFLRSYYLFKLVTTYSLPYSGNGVNPETALGVPLILSSQIRDGGLTRPTLKQTYDQIEKDLLEAADLLKNNGVATTPYRITAPAANAFLSRFYLLKGRNEDLDQVIRYAEQVLAEKSTLTPLTTFFTSTNAISGTGIFDPGNVEVLWVHGGNSRLDGTYFPTITGGSAPPYSASQSLISLYQQGPNSSNYGDLRYQMYFTKNSSTPYASAKSSANSVGGSTGFRVSEVYLNRAEALIRRFILTGNDADRIKALADLNYLRSNRYDTRNTAYVPVSITDPQALLTFYQQERRREMALENNCRWQDIRRWAIPVTHNFTGADGVSTVYTLPANSLLYALPIPFNALNNNPDLSQNPR
ncbi:RagB/SusD family nutrient uptake outer membrane protein [Pedobacter sp. KLB.chiD]|uniref:RagB/SusD family nutrient uptake outer membrane protein n=1 Tax=Pedobacter sp. KLB.chiD TaxID=3387402 RepID=UPI00399B9E18